MKVRDLVDFLESKKNGYAVLEGGYGKGILICKADDFALVHYEGSDTVAVYNTIINAEVGQLRVELEEETLEDIGEILGEWYYNGGKERLRIEVLEYIHMSRKKDTETTENSIEQELFEKALDEALEDLSVIVNRVTEEYLKERENKATK